MSWLCKLRGRYSSHRVHLTLSQSLVSAWTSGHVDLVPYEFITIKYTDSVKWLGLFLNTAVDRLGHAKCEYLMMVPNSARVNWWLANSIWFVEAHLCHLPTTIINVNAQTLMLWLDKRDTRPFLLLMKIILLFDSIAQQLKEPWQWFCLIIVTFNSIVSYCLMACGCGGKVAVSTQYNCHV